MKEGFLFKIKLPSFYEVFLEILLQIFWIEMETKNSVTACLPIYQSILSKIIVAPSMYPEFPRIPPGIFSQDGTPQWWYSIYKKWAAYYVILCKQCKYNEWYDVLDASKIVFMFTEYELQGPHLGQSIRDMVECVLETSEIQIFEEALWTVISKKLYNSFSEFFGNNLSNKLYELSGLYWDTMFSYLVKISLIPLHGRYIVLDTDIHFSRQELEKIKRAVYV